jgi:hypothetical protein
MKMTLKKLRFSFECAVVRFCLLYEPDVFLWTMTFKENLQDEVEAKKRFRGVCDLIRRRGGKYLGVWERQKRGAWHLHLLVNIYFDWTWFQKWLLARGWGEVLRVDRVYSKPDAVGLARWRPLARYLSKYLFKQYGSIVEGSEHVT